MRLFSILAVIAATGCSTSSLKKLDSDWSHRFAGSVTAIELFSNTGVTWLSQVIDDQKQYLIAVDRDGEALWKIRVPGPVREIIRSSNEREVLLRLVGHEDQIYSSQGKPIAALPKNCDAHWIPKRPELVCIHQSPVWNNQIKRLEFAIRVDAHGKEIGKIHFPEKYSKMTLQNWPSLQGTPWKVRVSEDGWNWLASTRDQVVHFNHAFEVVWIKRFRGGVLDLSVTSGLRPRFAILHLKREVQLEGGTTLSVFDQYAEPISEQRINRHTHQVTWSPDQRWIYLYGNGPQGQVLGQYYPNYRRQNPRWKLARKQFADFRSPLKAIHGGVVVGFEKSRRSRRERHSRLVFVTSNQEMKWQIPIRSREGGYHYRLTQGPGQSSRVVVATDDGRLQSFE